MIERREGEKRARAEREAWSLEQWKRITEERNAKKLESLKMIEAQAHTWITKENLDERVEQAVGSIMLNDDSLAA